MSIFSAPDVEVRDEASNLTCRNETIISGATRVKLRDIFKSMGQAHRLPCQKSLGPEVVLELDLGLETNELDSG